MRGINEMIKEAYAYGVSTALEEAGYPSEQAKVASEQFTQEKLAEEDEGLSGLEGALLGGGAGALLGAGGGALAGRITQSNLLRKLMERLKMVEQIKAPEGVLHRFHRSLPRGTPGPEPDLNALLAAKGALGQLGGSAVVGGGAGLGAGALTGGLAGGLNE